MTPPPTLPEAFDNDPDSAPVPDADTLSEAVFALDANGLLGGDRGGEPAPAIRDRLLRRAAGSRQRDAALLTVRRETTPAPSPRRTLHVRGAPARPGEPDRVELLTLPAGSRFSWQLEGEGEDAASLSGRIVEWLVLSGEVHVDGEPLAADDFCRQPFSPGGHRVETTGDARVYVRVGTPVRPASVQRFVARAAEAVWDGDAASMQRRVLWVDDAEVSLLIRARAGVRIPPHRHRVDEECLVIEGDIFAGDVLIRDGDFQLAPAGSVHGTVRAETDVLVYLRGDPDYEFVDDPAHQGHPTDDRTDDHGR